MRVKMVYLEKEDSPVFLVERVPEDLKAHRDPLEIQDPQDQLDLREKTATRVKKGRLDLEEPPEQMESLEKVQSHITTKRVGMNMTDPRTRMELG